MAHYAKVLNKKVLSVIVADEEFINQLVDEVPGEWIQCSYNTYGGIHYDPVTSQPSEDQSKALRMNFPGPEWNYDGVGFYAPQPYKYWSLNTDTYKWEPPIPAPNDGYGYAWSDIDYEEDTADPKTQGWVQITDVE
jgi:hypothetical protein